ncbi:MAG TPA: hypothetical protein VLX68_12185 [Chitinivibrionales bacterium]|nr:hypothetical protein [Chitinivibrionales bacterium]
MTDSYSPTLCRELERAYCNLGLHRPAPVSRYDEGALLSYDMEPVAAHGAQKKCRADLRVERFAGGGFAGQVYKVRVESLGPQGISGITVGGAYALKIFIPPSAFSKWFRDALYAVGFQGAFQLQCNPAAAKSGALWQKFIRRAARVRFGDERMVNDVHAIFADAALGSMGEMSDWIAGRTWRLEIDERMDLLGLWARHGKVDEMKLGSPEYRSKKRFMADFVSLLHDVGAHEFARQYEWSTWKSQPNCLKRLETDNEPSRGLVAVDFRAGLALLPFLPMSPGDVILILKGLARGSIVQFDRGDVKKLETFVASHREQFQDMNGLLDELKTAEAIYRDSVADITHHHFRIFCSGRLWKTMLDSAVTGWGVRHVVDTAGELALRKNKLKTVLFSLIGCVPVAGKIVRRLWSHEGWRRHYSLLLTNTKYLGAVVRGKMLEMAAAWHRAGRIDEREARAVASSFGLFLFHCCLSLLPAVLHKFLTNREYAKDRLDYIFVRPFRLFFISAARERWLLDMVAEGRETRQISEEDAGTIISQVKEPFIQKYLKSLAVHICLMPTTHVVAIALAVWYVLSHPEMPRAQAWAVGAGIVALFQVIPVSPGSIARGIYVLYLVIRERNVRDYNIALVLAFFKYVGYLAFPIQMAYRYPVLARFMAVHWATGAVHIVPVFGESGALLEHWVFGFFYNWPLTIRSRVARREKQRAALPPRRWHAVAWAICGAAVMGAAEYFFQSGSHHLPAFKGIVLPLVVVPFIAGAAVTLGAGGAALQMRIVSAAVAGLLIGILATMTSVFLGSVQTDAIHLLTGFLWRIFLFTFFAAISAILTEVFLPDRDGVL